jgi:hypothetical protein
MMTTVRVLIAGLPACLRNASPVHEVTNLNQHIKLCCGNSYEHFSYSGESRQLNGERLPLFTWAMRTKVAE